MVQASRYRLRQAARRAAIAGGLEAAWLMSRLGMVAGARGRGAIFTLHHVRPHASRGFAPNAHLEVTPEFLARAIEQLRDDGYEFVPLGEIPALLADRDDRRRFAAFTLDDGYRNNAEFALPVFARYGVPFTVFVTRGFAERTHTIWWETLAELLSAKEEISFNGGDRLSLRSPAEKTQAFLCIARHIVGSDEAAMIAELDATARRHGIDASAITARLTMSGQELATLAGHSLANLAAHTVSHRALAFLEPRHALEEMRQSADYVEAIAGQRPSAIAYPYGDTGSISPQVHGIAAEAGFAIAVTTRPGTLTSDHLGRLTSLPRISLNGFYQKQRHVAALASGIPFRLIRNG